MIDKAVQYNYIPVKEKAEVLHALLKNNKVKTQESIPVAEQQALDKLM